MGGGLVLTLLYTATAFTGKFRCWSNATLGTSSSVDIRPFYQRENDEIWFRRNDASRFAKAVANDFNPIHDPDARRFCVPGDLLFASTLSMCGVSAEMAFDFQQMVDESDRLQLIESDANIRWVDRDGKVYLQVGRSGEHSSDMHAISSIVDAYVKFSGRTFPFVLVDLMKSENVMINPSRPLVMYKSMALTLSRLDVETVELRFREASFAGSGKKGEVTLTFDLFDRDNLFGTGDKKMLLGGLRPYDQAVIDELVADYNQIKQAFADSSGLMS